MPYHGESGIDRHDHSQNASTKFYVACPACANGQGTYASEYVARHSASAVRLY